MLTWKGIPRHLFDDIGKLINDGVTCGVLDPLMEPLHTSHQSAFNMIEKMFPIPCPIVKHTPLESKANKLGAINPNLVWQDRIKVMTFEFKQMLEDILVSPEICN